ncbi:hypothetical protein BDW62DRAFT_159065 [Aspergillus aurantiobrunneus]
MLSAQLLLHGGVSTIRAKDKSRHQSQRNRSPIAASVVLRVREYQKTLSRHTQISCRTNANTFSHRGSGGLITSMYAMYNPVLPPADELEYDALAWTLSKRSAAFFSGAATVLWEKAPAIPARSRKIPATRRRLGSRSTPDGTKYGRQRMSREGAKHPKDHTGASGRIMKSSLLFRALSHDTSSGCRRPVYYLPHGDVWQGQAEPGVGRSTPPGDRPKSNRMLW